MLVAPQRSIGEFRKLAAEKLHRIVIREVPEHLTQFSDWVLEVAPPCLFGRARAASLKTKRHQPVAVKKNPAIFFPVS